MITIYGRADCEPCVQLKNAFTNAGVELEFIDFMQVPPTEEQLATITMFPHVVDVDGKELTTTEQFALLEAAGGQWPFQ